MLRGVTVPGDPDTERVLDLIRELLDDDAREAAFAKAAALTRDRAFALLTGG